MANTLWHVKFDVVRRSRGNHAVKVACYNAAARVQLEDGTTFDFRRKRKEHHGHAMLLPDSAPAWAASAGKLWAAAEAVEKRSDSQTARLVEFAIPRTVPPDQRMAFAQHVARPFVAEGMAVQVDIHCPPASDGLDQPHAHLTMTMRRFDGEAFAAKKELGWNDMFRANRGKDVHALMSGRMNDWLEKNGYESRVDHRSRKERGDDTPSEPDISKRSWEAFKRRPESAAAQPVHEILEGRKTRRQYQRARAAAHAAEVDLETASREWQRHQPGVFGPGKQRRQGERLTWNPAWSPKVGGAVAAFETKDSFAVLYLKDGGQIIDSGTRLAIRGKITDQAIAVIMEQARRHGWSRVLVAGSAEDQARIAAALERNGFEVANPPTLEPTRNLRAEYRPSWADGPMRDQSARTS